MNIDQVAEEIVDSFIPNCVTSSSEITMAQVKSLLEAQSQMREEALLRVKVILADALDPDD